MSPPGGEMRIDRRRKPRASATRAWALAMVCLIAGFVLWAHLGSGVPVFRSDVAPEPGWEKFRAQYRIGHFGEDGQFVRAVQNGYNLVYYTPKYAPRFTPTGARASGACASCHTPEDLAYGFVNSDRVDPKLGQRISFEDRVRRCYSG